MTSEEKRQRHKHGHRSRMEEARIAAIRARRRNAVVRTVVVVVVIAIIGLGAWALLKADAPDDGLDADGSTTTVDETLPDDGATTEPVGTPVELPPGPDGRTLEGETPCPATDGSEERVAVFAQPPPVCIADGEALQAEITISTGSGDSAEPYGTIVVDLDTEGAPQTVNNFVVLSRYGYYDGIPFHRLAADFVVQVGGAGTPSADGTGAPDYRTTGPGYDAEDTEYPADGYAVGDLAMARSETVSGSQFFIVTSEAGVQGLTQNGTYPRFGRVSSGLELAQAMSAEGTPDGSPTVLYTVDSIDIIPA